MGYVKSMLPDDWEPEQSYSPPKKYLCIGNKEIKAEWLPRWYDVPHKECIFFNNSWEFAHRGVSHDDCIILTPIQDCSMYNVASDSSKGSVYKQKLKELKLEKLLNGNDIR